MREPRGRETWRGCRGDRCQEQSRETGVDGEGAVEMQDMGGQDLPPRFGRAALAAVESSLEGQGVSGTCQEGQVTDDGGGQGGCYV